MTRRRTLRLVLALVVSALVNVGLFSLVTIISHERPQRVDITEPMAVRLVRFEPEEPPDEMDIVEPEKPEPAPSLDFMPDLLRTLPTLPQAPTVAVTVDRDLLVDRDWGDAFVFEADQLDQPPQVVLRVPPAYPYKARRRDIEGYVRVRFLVGADGGVSQAAVLEASPEGLFEESALRAVPKWRFDPGRIRGRPVASWAVTTIRFEMQ